MWEIKALNTLLCNATSIGGLYELKHVGANSHGENTAKWTQAWAANR